MYYLVTIMLYLGKLKISYISTTYKSTEFPKVWQWYIEKGSVSQNYLGEFKSLEIPKFVGYFKRRAVTRESNAWLHDIWRVYF